MSEQDKQNGINMRRKVMGDEHVDRALNNSDWFTAPVQDFIHEHAWGSTWMREGLPLQTRSLITIALLTALKAPNELKGHIRGALRNGCTKEEIQETLLHSVVYCGAPAGLEAFRAAKEALDAWSDEES